MAKKRFILPIVFFVLSAIFLTIGIITPWAVDKIAAKIIRDKVELTKSNGVHQWGEIPGKLDAFITRAFHMYNLTNPEEVMQGGVPSIIRLNGYAFQEFDKFVNVSYGDSVSYFLY